jgi:hypothetical protein
MLRIDRKGEIKDSSHDCNRGQHPASNNGEELFITMVKEAILSYQLRKK